jgi:hypothetical protein
MQRGIEEISCDRDVGLEEVSTVGQYGPREFMLACVESNKLTKIHNRPKLEGVYDEPWSCSASGAVAARRSEIRKTVP